MIHEFLNHDGDFRKVIFHNKKGRGKEENTILSSKPNNIKDNEYDLQPLRRDDCLVSTPTHLHSRLSPQGQEAAEFGKYKSSWFRGVVHMRSSQGPLARAGTQSGPEEGQAWPGTASSLRGAGFGI